MVEDGVLRRADVDEGRLHAGQDVLDPSPVDVAVDLGGVVGGPGDVVLDEGASLEQGDLGHVGADVDADHVAADRLAPALATRPVVRRAAGRTRSPARRRWRLRRRSGTRVVPPAEPERDRLPPPDRPEVGGPSVHPGRPRCGRRERPAGRGPAGPGRAGRVSPILGRLGPPRGRRHRAPRRSRSGRGRLRRSGNSPEQPGRLRGTGRAARRRSPTPLVGASPGPGAGNRATGCGPALPATRVGAGSPCPARPGRCPGPARSAHQFPVPPARTVRPTRPDCLAGAPRGDRAGGGGGSAGTPTGRPVAASDIEFPSDTAHEARSQASPARSAPGRRPPSRGSARMPSRSIHCRVLHARSRTGAPMVGPAPAEVEPLDQLGGPEAAGPGRQLGIEPHRRPSGVGTIAPGPARPPATGPAPRAGRRRSRRGPSAPA